MIMSYVQFNTTCFHNRRYKCSSTSNSHISTIDEAQLRPGDTLETTDCSVLIYTILCGHRINHIGCTTDFKLGIAKLLGIQPNSSDVSNKALPKRENPIHSATVNTFTQYHLQWEYDSTPIETTSYKQKNKCLQVANFQQPSCRAKRRNLQNTTIN